MRRPRFIAEQARHAKGLLGRLLAFIMARETWSQNLRAIAALDIQPHDHVLDIGCGHGRGLGELAARASAGRVVGADPSQLMIEVAGRRNRALVKAGRIDLAVAGVEALPFADAAFDKALCVHVVYFWKDLAGPFREIARVLRPGGRLALLFRTDADAAAVATFPPEVYRFPALDQAIRALEEAGFIVDPPGEAPAEPILLVARRSAR